MRQWTVLAATAIILSASFGMARQASTAGPYGVLKTGKVDGVGGFDYVYADAVGRSARGAAVDPNAGHGFSSSKPVKMWDTKTLADSFSNLVVGK